MAVCFPSLINRAFTLISPGFVVARTRIGAVPHSTIRGFVPVLPSATNVPGPSNSKYTVLLLRRFMLPLSSATAAITVTRSEPSAVVSTCSLSVHKINFEGRRVGITLCVATTLPSTRPSASRYESLCLLLRASFLSYITSHTFSNVMIGDGIPFSVLSFL